ncbi:MAG: LysM peptidoglycan-binding domain-containing protein [Bacillaceae bacterium]|nr:LysM peptidoglycan-binding domain-containing protein [Bacillaceae bacterium]
MESSKNGLIRVGQGLTIRNYINETYEVKQGDTLLKIAQETGVPVEKIKEINGLQTDVITIGSTLKLIN